MGDTQHAAVPRIPRIIHQTWRDEPIPPAWVAWQGTWRGHHPGWEYRFWTDLDLRELIRRDYRWFLPVYDAYPEHIKRVDAARYFIMHRHGGVYADMDFECLRPVDELLSRHEVILGIEPQAHTALALARARGLDRIVCNAFLASSRRHPFWDHVFAMLVMTHRKWSPLDATGPFFLTRALELYRRPEQVFLSPSEFLYPITSQEARDGLLADPAERARVAAQAFAIHHWSGSWWLEEAKERERERPRDAAGPVGLTLAVITWNRAARLRRLLTSVEAAAPPPCRWEVLVVDNNSTDATRAVAEELADRLPLRYVFEPLQGSSAARNRALQEAAGDLVVFVDDDVTVEPDFLVAYAAASRAHPGAAFFGGTIEVRFERPEPAWARSDPRTVVGAFGQLHVDPGCLDIGPEDIGPEKIPYGANFAVRRSRVGAERFDTTLGVTGKQRINGEETLFLARLLTAGAAGRWVPEAVVHHWIGPEQATPGHLWRYFVGRGRLQARRRSPTMDADGSAGAVASHLLHAALRWGLRKPSWVGHLRLAAVAFGEHRERAGAAIHDRMESLRREAAPAGGARRAEVGPARFVLFDRGVARLRATFDHAAQRTPEDVVGPLYAVGPAMSLPPEVLSAAEAPLLSCMMVTRRRAPLARRAIAAFREQTYPAKELVILDDDDDDDLARHVTELADPRIVHVRLPPGDTPLGALRNLAVDRSRGEFVSQWDDDDLSHPRRLELQMAAITALDADACFLSRHQLLWLDRPRLAVSNRRVWEGSMICAKRWLPRYPAIRRGEDTPVAQGLLAERRVVVVDAPQLYTYVFHGTNTFHEGHFESLWSAASERYEGPAYASKMKEILSALPLSVARDLATELGLPAPAQRTE